MLWDISREMNYRLLPDQIMDEWSTHDIKEFLTYHRILNEEHKAMMKKGK